MDTVMVDAVTGGCEIPTLLGSFVSSRGSSDLEGVMSGVLWAISLPPNLLPVVRFRGRRVLRSLQGPPPIQGRNLICSHHHTNPIKSSSDIVYLINTPILAALMSSSFLIYVFLCLFLQHL